MGQRVDGLVMRAVWLVALVLTLGSIVITAVYSDSVSDAVAYLLVVALCLLAGSWLLKRRGQ